MKRLIILSLHLQSSRDTELAGYYRRSLGTPRDNALWCKWKSLFAGCYRGSSCSYQAMDHFPSPAEPGCLRSIAASGILVLRPAGQPIYPYSWCRY